MLYGSPPLSHPLTGVFALLASKTLTLHRLASSLPVSNSNQSVGQSEGSGGGRGGGGHTKDRPMGVSTTPDCGFGTLSLLATSLLGTFPAILIVYHRGDITSHVCLIDRRLIFIHLTAGLHRLAISSSRRMSPICVKPCPRCRAVTASTLQRRCFPTLTWECYAEGMWTMAV